MAILFSSNIVLRVSTVFLNKTDRDGRRKEVYFITTFKQWRFLPLYLPCNAILQTTKPVRHFSSPLSVWHKNKSYLPHIVIQGKESPAGAIFECSSARYTVHTATEYCTKTCLDPLFTERMCPRLTLGISSLSLFTSLPVIDRSENI